MIIEEKWELVRQSEGSEHWKIQLMRPYREGKIIPVTLATVSPRYSGLRTGEGPFLMITPEEAEVAARAIAAVPSMTHVLRLLRDLETGAVGRKAREILKEIER